MPAAASAIRKNTKGGQLVFLPKPDAENLAATLDQMGIEADVSFDALPALEKEDLGEVSCIHKIKENRDIYYIANSSDSPFKTFVELRGKLKPELWFPESGKIAPVTNPVQVRHGKQVYTRFQLELASVKSVFVVGR
jgi:hypothetical protein